MSGLKEIISSNMKADSDREIAVRNALDYRGRRVNYSSGQKSARNQR